MNNKGESQVGFLLGLAIVLIVGAVLFQASSQQVGAVVNTVDVVNDTITVGADGENTTLKGKVITDFIAHNSTGDEIILAGNYTTNDNFIINGVVAATLTVLSAQYESLAWDVSYTYQPTTYISDSGGRALASIIILLFALALAVVAMSPTVRQKFE